MTEEFYRIQPIEQEERGNLKMLGLGEAVLLTDINADVLVVHIRTTLDHSQLDNLNAQLKMIFGQNTLVFAFEEKIDFLKATKMTEAEVLKEIGKPS
jgi:hypothetical protein